MECMRILLVHRKLSVIEVSIWRSLHGLLLIWERTFRQKRTTTKALLNADFTIFKTRNEYL